MAGELQTMLTWAEDRALLRSTPSAEPGAKTGARAEHTSALRLSSTAARQLRDWHRCDKPSRHDAARSGPRCRSPFIYANRTKFHFTVNQDTPSSLAIFHNLVLQSSLGHGTIRFWFAV